MQSSRAVSEIEIAGLRPSADLKPYENNARTHPREQIEMLKEAFRKFGFVGVIAFDEKGILAGHGRKIAADEMWHAGEDVYGPGKRFILPKGMLPCTDASGLSEADRKAFILADNQIAMRSGWDFDIAAAELADLEAMDFDLSSIGFTEADRTAFFIEREFGDFDASKEWGGMPQFAPVARSFRSIMLHFDTEADWKDFQTRIGQEISDKAKYAWHPFKERQDLKSQKWKPEDAA
jgi:hypothetical protein